MTLTLVPKKEIYQTECEMWKPHHLPSKSYGPYWLVLRTKSVAKKQMNERTAEM